MIADKIKRKKLWDLEDEYEEDIRRICMVYFPYDEYMRESLYNEIIYRIWRGLDKFRGDSDIETWITKIGINTAIECSRAEKRHLKDEVEEYYKESNSMLEELYEMINRLNNLERSIVYMYLDKKTLSEIAQATNLSSTNVATMISRIKLKLKKMKEDEDKRF